MSEKEFFDYVANILEVDPSELSMETQYGVFPQWSSLAHLCLISGFYEDFNVDIPIEQSAELDTLGKLYSCVKSLL